MQISLFDGPDVYNSKCAREVIDTEFRHLPSIITKNIWSPGVFNLTTLQAGSKLVTGLHRVNQNLKLIEILAADFDDGISIEEALRRIKILGYRAILGTTKSHQKIKRTSSGIEKPPCDRFRLVVPLSTPLHSDLDFKKTWETLKKSFPEMDNCKDSARVFLPCLKIVEVIDGSDYPVKTFQTTHKNLPAESNSITAIPSVVPNAEARGVLSHNTKNFLALGPSENESWHPQFIKAAFDIKQQGYSFDEAVSFLRKACTNAEKDLDETDRKQLLDVYENRGVKYPTRLSTSSRGSFSTQNFDVQPLSKLLTEPEEKIDWIVEGLLPLKGLSILVAKPKAGKSTLARCLCQAISVGADFLSRPSMKGKVIYLALEEKKSEVIKHFKDLGIIDADNILIHASSAPIEQVLEKLNDLIRLHQPILVVIDPLLRFIRIKDSNDYSQVTSALEPLNHLARESGAHLFCVHHAGKGFREGIDVALGSTAIVAAFDTIMMLQRKKDVRLFATQQRYGKDFEERILTFNPETRGISVGGTWDSKENERIGAAIVKYLEEQGGPVLEMQINHEVEGKNAHRVSALRELVKRGKVVKTGHGGKKNPFRYALSSSSHVPNDITGTKEHESIPELFDVPDVPEYLREQENNNAQESSLLQADTNNY